jgi:hypothetical protein
MEGSNPRNRREFRRVALKLHEHFVERSSAPAPRREPPKSTPAKGSGANLPLDFELKGLDEKHPYLLGRGFTPPTIAHFGLGFCNRGYLKGRVAIPLHNESGVLVGYAGRLIDDSQISRESPKYKFPGKREHDGQVFEFRKLDLLYNGNRIRKPVSDLVIVEGFPSVWWLHQHGFPDTVALMGSALGRTQAKFIEEMVSPMGRIWIMPDGNDAGIACAEESLRVLSRVRSVRWVSLDQNRQPTDCDQEELQSLLPMKAIGVAPSTLKERLRAGTTNNRQAIVELANSFPALRFLGLTQETWDAELVDARSAAVSSTERAAAQFVLAVWNPRARWNCGVFNALDALNLWDKEHRKAFFAWAENPWWP